jgi:SAM-dependent MidA family methyltransferase
MGSSPQSARTPVSAEFRTVFMANADANGTMTFARFMEIALYDPQVGYYRRERTRIGYVPGTDFFTSTTSGAVFGGLVAEACSHLLRTAQRDPAAHVFVELGAEPRTGGVLAGVTHPFTDVRTLHLGESLNLSGDCVVFSNELFDAQPFVRTVFRENRWREIGVRLDGDRLTEVELPSPLADPAATEGYRFDRPIAATELADRIAAEPWRGLFVAFDYGKTLRELTEETPTGTARAYRRHVQSNDLLAQPGEQDLTCHVCWDWIADALTRHGFAAPALEFQETFFVRHAEAFIASTSAADAAGFSPRKLALLQLLHPAHMGQKFQVMHALR